MSFRNLIPILFLTFWSAPAFAQTEQPTAIMLGLTMINGDDEISREMTMAVRMALLELGDLDITDRLVSGEQMVLVNECDSLDDVCLSRITALLHEQYVLYGTVRRSTTADMNAGFIVTVSLFDGGSGHTISSTEDHLAFPLGEGEMIASGRRIIERLFEGQTLYVAVPPPVTTVVASPVTPPAHPADHHESDLSAVGWTMLGVAVASLVADIGIWARMNDMNGDPALAAYRSRVWSPPETDLCSAAASGNAYLYGGVDAATGAAQVAQVRSLCSEGDALNVAQYVVLGLGIVSAGVGTTILALQSVGSSTVESSITLRPSVSPTSASLTIIGTF